MTGPCPLCEGTGRVAGMRCRLCRPATPIRERRPQMRLGEILAAAAALAVLAVTVLAWHIATGTWIFP